MKKILFVIVAAFLILSIFATGCVLAVKDLAPIHDIDIWADNSSPPQYFLYVVSGESTTCSKFDSYNVTHAGNTTIIVEIFNLRSIGVPCGEIYSYVEHTIPLGSDFIPDVNYTVDINDVTVNFVAGVIMIYPALILGIEIWADESLPPQYFVDVLSEEPSTCDQFDSYNVMRSGNMTILVDIFNRKCCTGCPDPDEMYDYNYARHTIPLGSDFVPGGNYMVAVNNVTETFVA